MSGLVCGVYVVFRVRGIGASMRSKAPLVGGGLGEGGHDRLPVAQLVPGQGGQVGEDVAEAVDALPGRVRSCGMPWLGRTLSVLPGRPGWRAGVGARR